MPSARDDEEYKARAASNEIKVENTWPVWGDVMRIDSWWEESNKSAWEKPETNDGEVGEYLGQYPVYCDECQSYTVVCSDEGQEWQCTECRKIYDSIGDSEWIKSQDNTEW